MESLKFKRSSVYALFAVMLIGSPTAAVGATVEIVDVVTDSGTTDQISEPSIAVDPANPSTIAITALTKNDEESTGPAPIYVSTDSGNSWSDPAILPSDGPVKDVTAAFSPTSHALYVALIDAGGRLKVVRITDLTSGSSPVPITSHAQLCYDQPMITALPTIAHDPVEQGKDVLFLGASDYSEGPDDCDDLTFGFGLASLQLWPDASESTDPMHLALDKRSPGSEENPILDGPTVSSTIAPDGTVYAAFLAWKQHEEHQGTWIVKADLVVEQADAFGMRKDAFQPGDGSVEPASVVVPDVLFVYDRHVDNNAILGDNRTGSMVDIAVDPNNSKRVFLAWADGTDPAHWALHLMTNTNPSGAWHRLLNIPSAINPSIAIANNGRVGLLYQQYENGFWATSVEFSKSGDFHDGQNYQLSWTPALFSDGIAQPMLGDYDQMRALNNDFIGAFCANNTPFDKYFPGSTRVRFLRASDYPKGHLYTDTTYSHTLPQSSIDPFFFRISKLGM